MRLKNLELHGYKTFASRTRFLFDGGITAIVGPNGSGKSNIADAIRWVLGEQSFRSLRGKRTEDMIFTGSAQRARLGMASASLILDNESGWLPTDLTEVSITRRAYRSGENEYMLNGHRVRLGDITELLSKSGLAQRTYTVIGQGLVDSVLSLRPDDRRALFEEAAGIAVYRSKRTEALARLEETQSNLLRVNDIVNEISPRLRRLERDAERAEQHATLNRHLEGLLRTLYGYRWHEVQLALRRARETVGRREVRLARRREQVDEVLARMAGLREQQSRCREQLSAWHRESSRLHRQMDQVQRDLAVWQERARLLARQGDELDTELVALRTQAQVAAEQAQNAEAELSSYEDVVRDREAAITSARQELGAYEAQREQLARQAAEAQARIADLATEAADRRSRLAQIEERRVVLAKEKGSHQVAVEALQVRAAQADAQLQAHLAQQDRLQAAGRWLAAETARLDAELAKVQDQVAACRAGLADAQHAARNLQSRHDLLTRLREEGEGLHAGARAVLREASTGRNLPGVVGTVAQLIEVPAQYEIAIEVALAGHVQDIVVQSWSDAEAAIAMLKAGRKGRATFLPLDTVRPQPRVDVPSLPGVIGTGADLVAAVDHQDRLSRVIEMLLGRTVVVQDLASGRRAFDRMRGGFQVVTLSGEVLRSSGSVTGGTSQEQGQERGQVLTREREWRELPSQLAEAFSHAEAVKMALAEMVTGERQVREQRASLAARRTEHDKAVTQTQSRRQSLERDADHAGQQLVWRQERVAQLDAEAASLDAGELSLQSELSSLLAEKQAAERRLGDLQTDLDQPRGDALVRRLSEANTAAAVARGERQHRRLALDARRTRLADLESSVGAKDRRVAALRQEQASLAEQIGSQMSQEAVVQGWLLGLTQKIEPVEAEVARLESEWDQLAAEEAGQRARLREAESTHAEAVLARGRQEERRQRLRRQIMDDFGLVDMEPMEGLPDQPPLPLAELVSTLPVIEALPEGLEEEIHQVRAQIRRMGSVNLSAPDEYAEALARHTFLTTQSADLQEAADRLRLVIAELDDVMRHEFQKMFAAVSTRFEANFARLFGGGVARLSLTDPEELSTTGVEITARPPGKRLQTLALLSGGERSLTAVALIFAFFQSNPPPFCILDEVDAMLDEANVQRFRAMLEDLAHNTQFILITHNRTTIQAANTIYGVSMGDDSASQVVSLRLEGDRIVAPQGIVAMDWETEITAPSP